jgi:hypothetical protein
LGLSSLLLLAVVGVVRLQAVVMVRRVAEAEAELLKVRNRLRSQQVRRLQ